MIPSFGRKKHVMANKLPNGRVHPKAFLNPFLVGELPFACFLLHDDDDDDARIVRQQ